MIFVPLRTTDSTLSGHWSEFPSQKIVHLSANLKREKEQNDVALHPLMGFCHHCSEQLTQKVTLTHKLKIHISGGAHQEDTNQTWTLLTHFTRHSQIDWFKASTE